MLCRSREGKIVEFWSQDGGKTWGDVAEIDVPNPNSGIDAVNLKGGRLLMIYNHTKKGRTPINVGVSKDGRTWTNALALETAPGEYSYPAVIQTADGLVHITYTWKRKLIRHVVLDPKRLP
jgi:predicted neuraminidase